MDLTPAQLSLAVSELLFVLSGGVLLFQTFGTASRREGFFGGSRLSRWSVSLAEMAILALLIFFCGAAGQTWVSRMFAAHLRAAGDQEGLLLIVAGIGLHGIGLLGWPLFFLVRRLLFSNYGTEPDAEPPQAAPARLTWLQVMRAAVATLAMALPVVLGANFLWTHLLHALGLPEEPQDLIGLFGGEHSGVVLFGMVGVACLLAPVNEELLFRGAIFRTLRQRFGRVFALAASSVFFGILHWNLAAGLPLALLGMAFALAYERTGDIRVTIVAHCLFNLNTIVIVLSGLPQ